MGRRVREVGRNAGQRPWGFWEIRAPELEEQPNDRDGTEYLRHHGLATDEAEALLTVPDDDYSVRMTSCRWRTCLPVEVPAGAWCLFRRKIIVPRQA